MRIKPILPAVMAIMISFTAWARESGETPDMDILEYLGTFESARGKEIDPMLLDKSPVENSRSKAVTPTTQKKKETKRNEPRKKEENDE